MASSSKNIPIYGNYHGYYNKRPSTNDPRLALLPRPLFDGQRILDVGCNEGLVTCEIGAKRVIGVDIDDTLVNAAWKHRRFVWSQQGPSNRQHEHDATNGATSLESKKRRRISESDAANSTSNDGIADYFPASCEHMFGPLPIPDATSDKNISDGFPHNVSFRATDWVENNIPEDTEGYDVVIAFSVSKWIHLNGGDDALRKFFRRVHTVLRSGGTFVFEPQEWVTYGKAKRIDPRLKENAKHLKLHPDDFERVLGEIGFGPPKHLGTVGEGGFRRPIDLYMKM